MRLAIAFLLAFVFAAAAGAADEKTPPPPTLQALDQKLGETFAKLKIPGANVAIIENNQVVLAKGYGLADVAAKTPVTPETLFRAGSISKGFVGVAVMMLVEEGKLDLNAKLADLAPEIKFTNKWEATDPVRLVHLMEHTTGFDDIRFSQYLFDGKDMPLKRAIELYGPYESRWKPGTLVSYSNAPPVIAAYIVEKVSGMSWADFTRTRIFEPLGMTSARWTKTPDIEARLSKSYRSDSVTEEPYVDIPGKPAGSLNITPSDLAKYALMLAGRGTLNGVTVLKPESVDRLERPESTLASRLGLKLGYGLGNTALIREKSVFHGHDGGIDGFLSLFGYEPTHGAGFVIMINKPEGEALKALDAVTGYLERSWPKVEPARMPAANLDSLAGFYEPSSPRQQMLAPLEALGVANITVENGKLMLDGIERVPVAPNTFQRIDRAGPSMLFVDTPEGKLLLAATGARRQLPMTEVAAKGGFVIAYALALLISVLFFIVWLISWPLGRLAERGGVLVRLVPTLAIAAPPVFLVTFLLFVAGDAWETLVILGTPSWQAQMIYGMSWAVPVLGALSLLFALIAPYGTSMFVRLLAFVNGALALGAAAYLWQFGWIGLKTWI